ncbi:helix-turn-helix domain-containing protein [Paludibacter sp.]|uniref:helix-turn-helix domain-containing protein n=1 Tax=Paludibacter sp. TaxID=1898105 RepID=UPI0025CF4EE3|nr:helix-turn-helix domain-containing protein [Paludibacter sp.]
MKIPKVCEICGTPFLAKTIITRYCSHKCGNAAARKLAKEREAEVIRQKFISSIPRDRLYISVREACVLFNLSKDTIHRLIRSGRISAINMGVRLTRINRDHLESMFPKMETVNLKPVTTKLNYDKEECYTIGEISKKFEVSDSTVNKTIRKYSIPKKQIGRFVYVPKVEIDRIFSRK